MSTTYNKESLFEQDVINYLTEIQQWEPEVLKYKTEDELVQNWADIIFENNKDLDRLNGAKLSESEMRQILEQLNACQSPVAVNAFINCHTVTITRDNPADALHLGKEVNLMLYNPSEIGGGKSRYQIAEQPIFRTPNPVARDRRGDFSILINGMPIIHVELKRSNVHYRAATNQIEQYTGDGVFSQGIFSLVQVFVAMTPEETVYFANPGKDGKFNEKYFFHWADFDNNRVNDWKEVAANLLKIPMAHQMAGYYTVADKGTGTLKVMRSYQYYAVQKIVSGVKKIRWGENNIYGGYVWHTTGSGKTLTSFKCAQLIAASRSADKVVFLVDRTELGTQTFNEYHNFRNSEEVINDTADTDRLVTLLKSNNPNDTLIVTSVQKMSRIKQEGDTRTRERDIDTIRKKRLVIIIDECHRSQFGEMNRTIKLTFPGAIFFGFSGTPILAVNERSEGKTSDVFGDELHRYTLSNAISDGNVLGFDKHQGLIYQERDIRRIVALNHYGITDESELDESMREEFFTFMNDTPIIDMERELPDSQYSTDEYTNALVDDILKNFQQISCLRKYHALFATSSIKEAVNYYNLFKAKISEMPEQSRIRVCALFDPSIDLVGGDFDKERALVDIITDYNNMFGKSYTIASYDNYKKDICNRLAHKKPYERIEEQDKIDILIVVDQMLTGFDSQWLNTLYLDKVLKYEGLIQAFSRTNRLAGGDKPNGVIKYYRRPFLMEKNVEEAVAAYSGNTVQGLFVDKLVQNVSHMNDEFLIIKEIFDSEGIVNFSKIPQYEASRKKFVQEFNRLNVFLSRANLQLFKWSVKTYTDDSGLNVTLLFDEQTYNILLQRYKELAVGGGSGGGGEEEPYDIDTYVSDINTGTINADYMQNKFIQWIGARNSATDVEKTLSELHNTFALLTQEQQYYAGVVVSDIQSGKLIVDGTKTLMEYIGEYMVAAQNSNIHECAEKLGLDEAKLKNAMLQLSKRNIGEFGILEDLEMTADRDKVKAYFDSKEATPIKKKDVIIKLDELLRRFIIEGSFKI